MLLRRFDSSDQSKNKFSPVCRHLSGGLWGRAKISFADLNDEREQKPEEKVKSGLPTLWRTPVGQAIKKLNLHLQSLESFHRLFRVFILVPGFLVENSCCRSRHYQTMVGYSSWNVVPSSHGGLCHLPGVLSVANTHANTTLVHSGAVKVNRAIVLRTQSLWQEIPQHANTANDLVFFDNVDGNFLFGSPRKDNAGVFGGIPKTLNRLKSAFLQHWKVMLPLLWMLHAVASLSSFSTTHLLVTFAASVTPLLKDAGKSLKPKLALHHFIRDSGLFGVIMDTILLLGLPTIARQQPTALKDFRRLGSLRNRIFYGTDSSNQVLDMYLPFEFCDSLPKNPRGLIFFVVRKRFLHLILKSKLLQRSNCTSQSCSLTLAWW